MDPIKFLRTKDPLVRQIMQRVAIEARELQRQLDLERAQVQANEIGRLFSK